MFQERSKTLLISVILATAYFIYLVCYFTGILSQSSSSEQTVGSTIATTIVMPHMIVLGIGALFAWIGFFIKVNWAALVGAILYAISALLFLPYFMFSVPILIFGFIGYAMQRKVKLHSLKEGK